MSKKKMRAFAGAMAVVLAFVPFLSGCAANDAEDNPQAQQELNADEQSRNEAEGSIGETVQYGQVMAMNGSTATVGRHPRQCERRQRLAGFQRGSGRDNLRRGRRFHRR